MAENQVAKKEPLVHITRRYLSRKDALIVRILGVVAALIAVSLFALAVGKIAPWSFYKAVYDGSFGNKIYVSETLYYAAKLLCIAVALAPAFKMKFWNIGGEGQVLVGALAATILMMFFPSLPNWLLLILMAISACLAGAMWGAVPAVFKAKWGTNETLFTLMMNYVATCLVKYFYDSWKGEKSALGIINQDTKAGWLPSLNNLFGASNKVYLLNQGFGLAIIIVLIVAVLMFFYMNRTKHGYEISVVGGSANTARYAGINVGWTTIRTMLLSGAICGLCGFLAVSGRDHSISSGTAGGYGFTALIVAWLAKFNTLYMIVVAVLLVALSNGTKHVSDVLPNFPDSASAIVTGIILFFVIGCEFFIEYKPVFRKSSKEVTK